MKETIESENAKLKEFARSIISISDPDGGDVQELAIKSGLIEIHIATAEDVDDEFDDFEPGDEIYINSAILKEEPPLVTPKAKISAMCIAWYALCVVVGWAAIWFGIWLVSRIF